MKLWEMVKSSPVPVNRFILFFIAIVLYLLLLPFILVRKVLAIPFLACLHVISYIQHRSDSEENMLSRFSQMNGTSLDLTALDTSRATNMSGMFMLCKKVEQLDVSNFVTGSVTNMSFMFYCCQSLKSLNLSYFRTSHVTNMYLMFGGCKSLETLDVSYFDTSSVTNMKELFRDCESLTQLDLSSFDTSRVTDMSSLFQNCKNLQSIGDDTVIDMTSVEKYTGMFYHCDKIRGIQLRNVPSDFDYKRAGLRDDQFIVLPPVYHGDPQMHE